MKRIIVIVSIIVFTQILALSQSCLPDGITFTSQGQIDNFQVNYPSCTEIEGDVKVSGLDHAASIGGGHFLYPNPVKKMANFNSGEIATWELYDMMGTLIVRGVNKQIDMSNLNPGIYFVVGFDINNSPLYKEKVIIK